ncbi:hypothetical protein TWF696_004252 [Orbilia brochopaga]|uniref:Uncharacterized protein n=1 Tax=Orbilia brochopaga TaxID=3140254 RepID=A0AAV9V6S9_9PEZI
MRASRFLPAAAAARGCRRRGTPLHVSDHLWISESLVRDVFRTFCLRWAHASTLRRPSAKAGKCYTFQPLRQNRAESTSPDSRPIDDAPSTATKKLFSWSFNDNFRGIIEAKRLPLRPPTTARFEDIDTDDSHASLFVVTEPLRSQLNHLIKSGTCVYDSKAKDQSPTPDPQVYEDIRELVREMCEGTPSTRSTDQLSSPASTKSLPITALPEEIPPEEPSPEEPSPEELSSEELSLEELPLEELPPEELPSAELSPEELPSEELPLEELSSEKISPEELPPEELPSTLLVSQGKEHAADQKPSTIEKAEQVHPDTVEFKIPVRPPIDMRALLTDSEHSEAVEALESVDFDKIESPDFIDEIVLKQHERIQLSPLPSQQDFETELLEAISDQRVTIQTLVLMYAQFDKLVGIENFSDLPKLREALYARLGGMANEWLVWLFRHDSTKILRQPDLMPRALFKKMVKFNEAVAKITPEGADTKPITREDALLDSIWNKIKLSAVFKQWYPLNDPGFVLRFEHVDRILDKAIARIKQGEWDDYKKVDVETCLDIFFFYKNMNGPMTLLFPRVVELFQAWMPHWKNEKYAAKLKKTDPSAPRDDSALGTMDPAQPQPSDATEAASPFKAELIRRIMTQKVRHHLLSTGSERIEKKFNLLIPGLQRFLDCLPGHYRRRLISTLFLSRASPAAGNANSPNTPWTDAWTLDEILPFKPWVRRSLDLPIKYNDGDHLTVLRDATDLFEAILATKGHEAMTAYCYNMDDMQIVEFHLRQWVSHYGTRYFNDKELLDELQNTMKYIAERVRASTNRNYPYPGQPFAQAILSLFYLNIPAELFIVDIIRTLAFSDRYSQMLSCLAILQRFSRRTNGDVVFKVPKHAMKMALMCLRRAEPFEALRLLSQYHNRHGATWGSVLISTAQEYPKETHFVLRRFLVAPYQTSIFNPQIRFGTPRGRPTRNLFSQLAVRYALSSQQTPSKATYRINHLRRLALKHGLGYDIRISRALVVAAMVRSGIYRIQTGPEFEKPSDLWKHGRIVYASRRFLEDANRDPTWKKGLTKAQAMDAKKQFLEQCMLEVWKEIKRWQDHREAVKAKHDDMSTTTI